METTDIHVLIDDYNKLTELSNTYIENNDFDKSKIPLFVSYFIKESINLNLKKEKILEYFTKYVNENIQKNIKGNIIDFELTELIEMSEKFIDLRFTKSILNKQLKLTHITNVNNIKKNCNFLINQIIKKNNITLNNLNSNIYILIDKIIMFINQYEFNDKESLIKQILTDNIKLIIDNEKNLTNEQQKIIKNIENIINILLPNYILTFINEETNNDVIKKTKCITQLCCMILSKKS